MEIKKILYNEKFCSFCADETSRKMILFPTAEGEYIETICKSCIEELLKAIGD
jgi:hypothetical protein